MDFSVQKRPRCQHHGAGHKPNAKLGDRPYNPVSFEQKVIYRLLEKPEIGLIFKALPNRRPVQHPVGLSACGPNCRALGRVQDSKLDSGFIGCRRHGAAERIDLAHQMPLANTANRGIAAHLPQGFQIVGQQQGLATHARRRQGGLCAGMATTNDDDIKMLRVKHGCGLSSAAAGIHQASRRPSPILPAGKK